MHGEKATLRGQERTQRRNRRRLRPSTGRLIASVASYRPAPQALRRAGWVVLAGCLLCALLLFVRSSVFRVKTIQVLGAKSLSTQAWVTMSGLQTGGRIFSADVSQAQQKLTNAPWVDSVSVYRKFPSTLIIDVKERAAAAVVNFDGLYLADEDGRAFSPVHGVAAPGKELGELPYISGIERADAFEPNSAHLVRKAIEMNRAWNARTYLPKIGEYIVSHNGVIQGVLEESGALVELGDAPSGPLFEDRMLKFYAAWSALSEMERLSAKTIFVSDKSPRVVVSVVRKENGQEQVQ